MNVQVPQFCPFEDPGVVVTDDIDNGVVLTNSVVVEGLPIDTSMLGESTITYSVKGLCQPPARMNFTLFVVRA